MTIGGETFPVPQPFLVMATQNPIEAEGTYPLPEAQVDRFLMKVLVDYPTTGEEAAVVGRSLGDPAEVRELPDAREPRALRARRRSTVLVDRERDRLRRRARRRHAQPGRATGWPSIERFIEYGASPRGPIGLVQAARALALLRGRGHVSAADVRDLAPTCCATGSCSPTTRSAENVTRRRPARARGRRGDRAARRPPAARRRSRERRVAQPCASRPRRQGPGPMPQRVVEALDLVVADARGRRAARRPPRGGRRRRAPSSRSCAPTRWATTCATSTPRPPRASGEPHVRLHVPERTLTTWIVLDVSPSMAFGTRGPAEVGRRRGRRARARRGSRCAARAASAAHLRRRARRGCCPPRASKPGVVGGAPRARRGRRRRRPRRSARARARALRRLGEVADQPGLVVVDLRLPRPARTGRGRSARCARATRCSPSRCATRARASCRAVGRLAVVDPETGERVEVDTSQPRACASASPQIEARAAAHAVARELRRLRVDHVVLSHRGRLAARARAEAAVSFAAPIFLLGAAARAAGHRRAASSRRRRARRYAVRFTAAPSAASSRGRHACPPGAATCPPLLALAALAALALALAKPQRTVAVPVERASIMLVTDHSRSMLATDVEPEPADAPPRGAARAFLDELPDAACASASSPTPTRPTPCRRPSTDHDDARRVDRRARWPTAPPRPATRSRWRSTRSSSDRQAGEQPPAAIVLLSDGKTTVGRDPVDGGAHRPRRLKIPIYTDQPRHRATPPCRTPTSAPAAAGAARPGDARADRRGLRRPRLHGRGRRTSCRRSTRRSARSSARRTRSARSRRRSPSAGLMLLLGAAGSSVALGGRIP